MKDLVTPKKKPRVNKTSTLESKAVRSKTGALKVLTLSKQQPPKAVSISKKPLKKEDFEKIKKIKSPFQKEIRPKEVIVAVPQNMSIRAREKALALFQYFRNDFEDTAKRISTVSGFAFILFGSYLALSFSGTISTQTQFAQLVTNFTSTTSNASNTLAPNTTTTPPLFSVVDRLPAELLNNQQFTFSLTNAKNIQVKAISLADGTIFSINSRSIAPELYQYDLDRTTFKPGYYSVKISAESSVTQTRYTYTVGDFKIPTPPSTPLTSPSPATATTTSTQQTITNQTTVPSGTSAAPTPTPAVATTTTTTADSNPVTETPPADTKILKLTSNSNLSGQAAFRVEAPPETTFLEVYARPVKSINTRFLGLAEKRIDAWYYFFNSVNVPNGDYEIHARSRITNTFIDSNSVNVHIANFVQPKLPLPLPATAPTPTSKDTVTTNLTTPHTIPDSSNTENSPEQNNVPTRKFSDLTFEKMISSSSPVHSSVNGIFETHREQLNDLLKRYAVAHQTGDEILLRTVESEIKKLKIEILTAVLDDSSKNALAHGIEGEFDSRIDSLKTRINTFEDLRRTSDQGDVRKDTDGDGISDFDENNLYHTDAHLPDTDNDGFTDGIEIVRGFNPNNAAGEATVTYELPQDTVGLEQADVLKIDEVLPSVKQTSDAVTVVQSEIHGKALPNSYVTLYIFSTPTIVTVRTDADGSFVYTFEKELEDGEHQVYAAVTDNTGNIVAHSSPFKFIKEAQAYTPTNETGTLGVNSQTLNDYKKFNLYNTVIGVGILGLGIILLMLGFGIGKRRDDETVIITENDLKTS